VGLFLLAVSVMQLWQGPTHAPEVSATPILNGAGSRSGREVMRSKPLCDHHRIPSVIKKVLA